MNVTFFPPVDVIELGKLQDAIQRLSRASGGRDYQEAARQATLAINQTLHTQLLDLLDSRAYSNAMQGRPDLAITDTQRMTGYSPTKALGYLRKGMIFSRYGYQIQAVEAYDEGIQNAAPDSPKFEELKAAREAAIKLNETRVDVITESPLEIANHILSRLPQEEVASCLGISKTWRKRTLVCERLWRELSVGDDAISVRLFNMTPYIARHVQHLKINTKFEGASNISFKYMKKGLYVKIQSLEMSAVATRTLRTQFATISVAFWETRRTLTTLDLNFSGGQNPIKLAEILAACCSVIKLTYTNTTSSMSAVVGDFSMLRNDHPLASLRLSAVSIIGTDIEAMLQRCQQLRHLIMKRCDETVLDQVNMHAPNLKVLGYNYPYQIEDMDEAPNNDIPGLQEIYTQDEEPLVSASRILPLLYRNMDTLVVISVRISSIPASQLQQFRTTYANLKFPKLAKLTLWFCEGIQNLMLQAIRDTSTLTSLSLNRPHHLQVVVDTVLKMPPLTRLRISHTNTTTFGESLIRLFDNYSKLSKTQQSLQVIILQDCKKITDVVLSSLSGIKTLCEVTLQDLDNVTGEGIREIIRKTETQLTKLVLTDLAVATDEHISALSECKYLKQVELHKLSNVSDQGLRNMLDGGCCLLDTLTIVNCEKITDGCIQYARQKVKTVVYS